MTSFLDATNGPVDLNKPQKGSQRNTNNPQFMKGFKKVMFTGRGPVKGSAGDSAGEAVSGRQARSVITAKKQQRREEAKNLKASVTTLLKKGTKRGRVESLGDGGSEGHPTGIVFAELGDNVDDDGYAELGGDGAADGGVENNNPSASAEDRYRDANYVHTPNGLDLLFATVQRSPALMYPPRDRFAARDKLVSGALFHEAVSIEKKLSALCSEEEPLANGRDNTTTNNPVSVAGGVQSLRQLTSPASQRQRAASAGKKRDDEVRNMLSLLGAKLSKGAAASSTGEGPTAVVDDNDRADCNLSSERQRIEREKADLQVQYQQISTSVSSATHHHKQLDAYLTCLLEFNHGMFGSLPLADTLINCCRLGKTDASMHLLTFEEHTKAMRKRKVELAMERRYWSAASHHSAHPTTTAGDVEQIRRRAAEYMGGEEHFQAAAAAALVSQQTRNNNNNDTLRRPHDDVESAEFDLPEGDAADIYEAEMEGMEEFFRRPEEDGDYMQQHPGNQDPATMDPYEYLMRYGVPPPSMMAAATVTPRSPHRTASNTEEGPCGTGDEEATEKETDPNNDNTTSNVVAHCESTFTATLVVGEEVSDNTEEN